MPFIWKLFVCCLANLTFSGPGWDKIFYFVGANTFSLKFRQKQRESDVTEGVQSSGNLGVKYGVYKSIFSVSINANLDFCFFNLFNTWLCLKLSLLFLIKKMSCCDKKFLTMALNSFLWQEVSFCDRKFLPLTRIFFLWQEISFCDMKFLFVTRHFF